MLSERVLSIQSHVVFGYVGGKAAVFPLQCLGYDVDVINTVNYSNHTGYGRVGGTKATAEELDAMFAILQQNELLMPARLLTGYIPGAEALSTVARVAKKLSQERPHLIYLLDPVMGDEGQLYVSPDVISVYKKMLPLATVITPNWFEVEVLTEISINDIASLQQALRILHSNCRVPHIVISSIPLKPWLLAALPGSISPPSPHETTNHLCCLISSTSHPSAYLDGTNGVTTLPGYPHPSIIHAACVPLIPGYFSGVGDLFSALLLAHFHPYAATTTSDVHSSSPPSLAVPTTIASPGSGSPKLSPDETPLSYATSLALTKTHAILSLTNAHALTLPPSDRQASDDELDGQNPMRKVKRMRGRELKLVQGQDIIRGVGLTEESTRWMVHWDGFWQI